jgi:hypothetical protein
MNDQTTAWVAWGLIGAAALPNHNFELGPNIRIELAPPDRLHQLLREEPVASHPHIPWPEYFSTLPARLIVRSSWVIWLRATATNADEAWDLITNDQLPIVVAALSVFGTPLPRIELLRIGREDSKGVIHEPRTKWIGGTFGGFATRHLSQEEVPVLTAIHSAANRFATSPSRHFYEALCQRDQSDHSSRNLGNTILSYFLVIEEIAQNAVLRKQIEELKKPDNETDDEEKTKLTEILDELRRSLKDDTEAATHIRSTEKALNDTKRLKRQYLNQKIEDAGTHLGIEQSTITDSLEIARIRNSSLGHPGHVPSEVLLEFVETAEHCSTAFLSAFIRWSMESRLD